MQDKPLNFISSLVFSACFLVALILPVAENLFHFGPQIPLSEKRRLRTYPSWQWNPEALLGFPARFEAAFNDHFGFRAFLVRTEAWTKFYWFHVSPSSKVVIGRDGWFYLSESIDEYRGIRRLPRVRLQDWIAEFKAKKAFLESRHIKYLMVVPPNKETVYPEFLPTGIRQFQNKLYIDDLIDALPPDCRAGILDLRKPLIAAKSISRTYWKTDSHWNQLGAAVGSNAIIDHLASWFQELRPSSQRQPYRYKTGVGRSGDLAELIGLADRMKEQHIALPIRSKSIRSARLRSEQKVKGAIFYHAVESTDQRNHLDVIITGDSFSNALYHFLPAHFRRTLEFRPYLSVQDPVFRRLVAAEQPHVYLEIVVDRHLANPPRVLSPAKKSSAVNTFNDAATVNEDF